MDKKIIVFGTGLILLILLAGFFLFAQNRSDETATGPTEVPAVMDMEDFAHPNEDETTTPQTPKPKNVTINSKKLANNYFVFEKSEYEKAKAANRPILLFFYANWCPTCARQEPINVSTFNSFGPTNLIAFRVNFNDTDTNKDEDALAKEFAVPYQHNFYLLDSTGKQIEHFQGDTSEAALKERLSKVN